MIKEMKVIVNGHPYRLVIGYQRNQQNRDAFNKLATKTFNLSFETWYELGYWNQKYIPYTLFDADKAVANVSINLMDFNVFGKLQRYVQIGTVMTDEKYCNKGLSRFLMEKVLEEWTTKCDLIYLYANHSVLDFYPKFGFYRVKEYEYYKSLMSSNKVIKTSKLDMDKQSDKDMLYQYAKNTVTFGKLSMQENADLVMFYCTSFLKECVYYLDLLDVIVVAQFNQHQLYLWEVFSIRYVDLDKVIFSLADLSITEVRLGFIPNNMLTYSVREFLSDDVLFIYGDKLQLFNEQKLMFPLLSHA